MEFKDNFSEILLIAEAPVMFYLDDTYLKDNFCFYAKLITIKDSFLDPYLQNALALCHITAKQWQEQTQQKCSCVWDMLQLYNFDYTNFAVRSIYYLLTYMLGDQLAVVNNLWTIKNIDIDKPLLERLCDVAIISAGLKKFNAQSKFQAHKPQWLIDKEAEIQRIKSGGQNKISDSNQYEELLKVIMPINYELGYTFDEIFNMNYFHIQALTKFIPKIIGYDIQKRQIMSKKKLKYITDK